MKGIGWDSRWEYDWYNEDSAIENRPIPVRIVLCDCCSRWYRPNMNGECTSCFLDRSRVQCQELEINGDYIPRDNVIRVYDITNLKWVDYHHVTREELDETRSRRDKWFDNELRKRGMK